MQQKIVELYEPERVARLEKRCLIVKRLLWILALTVLGVCIYLNTRVNTRNIYRLLLTCICVSVPAAWIILYFGTFVVRDGKRELAHIANLEGEPRETVTGKVTLLKLKVQIRNSVSLRKVRVDTPQGVANLNILINRAYELPHAGELLRLYVVHGYIVAYEVLSS